jgi:para-nitrobenzyl esterase
MRPLADAESIAVEYARAAGIQDDDDAALAALRALPAETLCAGLDDYVLSIVGGPEIPGLSHSILDGRLVVEPPEATLRAGRQAPVPVLVGANDADLAASPAHTKAGLFAAFGALEPQARKLYDPYGNASLSALIQTVTSDELMVEPTRNLAQLVTRDAQPAWLYRFSYVAEAQRGKVPGALHAAEIAYVFDLADALLGDKATPGDVAMSSTLSAYWTAFARTGDPNGPDRPAWPRYDPASNQVLNFTNDGALVGPDPLQPRLDLWQAVWDGAR